MNLETALTVLTTPTTASTPARNIKTPSFYRHALYLKSAGRMLFSDSQKSYELGNGLDCADNTGNDLDTC